MKKHSKNRKRIFRSFLCLVAVVFMVGVYVDFIRFPECYMPTWRYQLKRDLAQGDVDAVEYYERVYVANGRELFAR